MKLEIGDKFSIETSETVLFEGLIFEIIGLIRCSDGHTTIDTDKNVQFHIFQDMSIIEYTVAYNTLKATNVWISEANRVNYKFNLLTTKSNTQLSNKCSCDMTSLMRFGCQCGAFNREKGVTDA